MRNSKTRGATKVPNVKLRPAQASSSHSTKRQTSLPRVGLRDDDVEHDEVDISTGNKPFAGIVLCATGDLDKRTLFAHAQELGAIRANDFTDQVTHLVADAPGSAKYRCAVERHLPILKASWVEEAYQTWLNGEVVDLEQTLRDHRLPIFSGVRLCLTGMDDLKLRNRIHTLLAEEDGVYLKSLDKTATHLLSCALEESPKLKWASDHNKTQIPSNRMHLVWEEWFWDSLEFGGRWDEREYEVTNPRPSLKSLSQIPQVNGDGSSQNELPTATLSQRTPIPSSIPTSILIGDDPPEYGNMIKVPHARQHFYSSIFQEREKRDIQRTKHSDVAGGPILAQSPPKPAQQHQEIIAPRRKCKAPPTASDHEPDPDSVLTRLANHRVTSFGSSSQPRSRQLFPRIISSTSSNAAADPQGSSLRDVPVPRPEESQLFMGCTFRAFGEANGPNLRGALEARGGRWLTEEEEEEEADFLVVRLVNGGMYWRGEGDELERAKYRTECWIERCIFEERICAPHEHVVFTPLRIETPIIGSENLRLSLSGLDTAEACWVKRLIRALGGNISTTFSRHSTHLICPSGRGAKFDKAKEWGVDVVGTEWLIEIATAGRILDAKQFAVALAAEKGSTMDVNVKQDVKGKGKATEVENDEDMIVDITNGVSQDSELSKRHDSSSTPKTSNLEHQKRRTSDSSQSISIDALSNRIPTLRRNSPPVSAAFMFGKPSSLLSGLPSASPRKEGKLEPAPLPPLILRPPSSHLPSDSSKKEAQSRRYTAAEVEQDKQMTLIPSSHSPSPLKVPSKPASAVSSPPVRETHGLRTAITALLGKRDTEDRDEMEGPAQKRQGRATNKRPRIPSRTKSDLEPRRGPSPALSFLSGSPPLSRMPHPEDVDVTVEEGQASLRVVYEDPGQRAEKKKLIALFEGGTSSDAGKDVSDSTNGKYDPPNCVANARPVPKRKSARRSTRTSGG